MPLQVIITAAKTVSRASELVSGPPDTINVTINATSMTVTRDGEDERPEWLADSMGDDLGVGDRGQDRGAEDHRHHDDDHCSRLPTPGKREHQQGDQRREHCPGKPGARVVAV